MNTATDMTFVPAPRAVLPQMNASHRSSLQRWMRLAIVVLALPMLAEAAPGVMSTDCNCRDQHSRAFAAADRQDGMLHVAISNLGNAQPVSLRLSESLTHLWGIAESALSAIAISARHFDFGRVEVGVNSDDRTLVITSRSGLLKIRSITVTGDYTGSHNCPRWLDVGKSCQITGRFRPRDIGERRGRVSILTNLSSTPTEVSLSGTGF